MNDDNTAKCYSEALDISLGDTSSITDINELGNKIASSIQSSSEATIPTRENVKDTRQWVDDTFRKLVESRNKFKKKNERLQLNELMKNYRNKIKNDYYGKKVASINMAMLKKSSGKLKIAWH